MRESIVDRKNNEALIYAEEGFIADVQFAIHNLLEAKKMSRADLARAVGVSESRISQMFSDNPRNLTLRTIARVFHALGEEPELTSRTLARLIPTAVERERAAKPEARHAKAIDELLAEVFLERANFAQNRFESKANDNACEITVLEAEAA